MDCSVTPMRRIAEFRRQSDRRGQEAFLRLDRGRDGAPVKCPITPMRPGLTFRPFDEHHEDLPAGDWTIQYKLDDERAVLTPDGQLWNRFGAPYARNKAARFENQVKVLSSAFPGAVLDCALVGVRRPEQPHEVVVLDLPEHAGTFLERHGDIVLRLRGLSAFGVRCLNLYSMCEARCMLAFARRLHDFEGLIGRRLGRPYVQGTSNDMFRCRVR